MRRLREVKELARNDKASGQGRQKPKPVLTFRAPRYPPISLLKREVGFTLIYSAALVWCKPSVTSHFNVTSEKKSHLHKEISSGTDTGVVLTKRPYLSLRIFQYNLHIFTSAPRVLVLPDEVGGRTGCDTSICSPDLEKRKDISSPRTQPSHIPALPYPSDGNVTKRLEPLILSLRTVSQLQTCCTN